MKDGPARPASLTQEGIPREGLIQNGHATLHDGDPGAGERQDGDIRSPVIVRAPTLGPRHRSDRWGRRDAEENSAVLDLVRRARLRHGDGHTTRGPAPAPAATRGG